MPDVFDQIAPETAVPQGDVFDRIAPDKPAMTAEQFLNTDHGPLTPQEQQAMAVQRANPATPPAAAPQPMGAIRNAFTAGFHAVGDPLGNAGVRALAATGLISPQQAQAGIQNQLFHPEEGRLSAKVGAGLGQAAQTVLGAGVAPLAFGIEQAETAKENVEARQAAGQQITPGAQAADVAGQAALGYGLGAVAPGGKVLKPLLGKLPGVLSRIAAGGVVGAGEQAAQQVASNLITKKTVAPEQKLGEGVGEAAITGAAFGAGGQGLHEGTNFLSRMRSHAVHPVDQTLGGQPHENAQAQTDQPRSQEVPHVSENRPVPAVAEGQPAPADHAAANVEPRPQAVSEHAAENAKGTDGVRGAAEGAAEHPSELKDAAAVGDWYAKTFDDKHGAMAIEALASMGKGKFKLADVPSDKLDALNFQEGDKDQGKVDSLSKLSDEDKSKLPPVIAVPGGEGKLAVADGSHRTLMAQQTGQPTVRAYVPEEFIGQHGITEAGKAPKPIIEMKPEPTRQPMMRSGKVAVPDALTKLAERDVAPSVLKTSLNLRKSLQSIHRFIGSGLDRTAKEEGSALNIRESLGKQDLDRIRTESALKPFREHMEKWSPDAKRQWVEAVEAGQPSPDPKTQAAADLIRNLNDKNIAEAAKYGIEQSKGWNTDYIGRVAEFPQEPEGTGSKSTIAGAQKFLKKRVYDTFGEFKDAVEAAGGKLKYDNPLDMALAKQNEIRQSIEARKLMYGEENRGTVKWVPNGEKPPEGFDVKLKDRLADQERPEIAPKKMIARLAGMAHFDAQRFMESKAWKDQAQILRPGDTIPAGFSKTGQTVRGTFHGTEGTANVFNQMVNPGLVKDVPVLGQLAQAKRRVVGLNLGLSAVHGALESVGNMVTSVGRSMDNLFHGETGLAWQNLKRANPASMYRFGRDIREQAQTPTAHPSLEPLVQTSLKGGNRFDIKSVLTKDDFAKAREEFKEGNKIGGVGRTLQGIYHTIHAPLFEKFIPNLRAGAKAAAAETALKRGLSGTELSKFMGLAQDNIDNMMGSVIRSHQFQNKILTDLQDLIFTAPKFAEGTFRHAGATGRDTVRVFTDLASGKTPKLTPAMYTAMAGAMTHMIGAAIVQTAYTAATTGTPQFPTKLHDYFAPRTGRKDDEGRDERISLLTPFSALFSMEQHGTSAITGRVAGAVKGAYNAATGVDDRGVQIRNPDEGAGKQALDTAKYAGKQLLPYSVQNLMEQGRPGASKTLDAKIGAFVGARFYHESGSEAERLASDIGRGHARQAPRTQDEAEHSDLIRKLAQKERESGAGDEIEKGISEGKLSAADAKTIHKQATEQHGLGPMLKRGSYTPAEVMRVWDKMTPQEKEANEDVVRRKLAGSRVLSKANRQKFMDRIDNDLAVGVK